ncbi:uncharacterized protein LOC130892986 [Diorhabda carinulata]|uniref:uncharacterized protein LOC130892986 n=1 Tax=Diorhabda carinulata TaxID=1163345 RepID=UPI00259FEE50|nr:uncharacterized protein LOC130892986 [Diorhabda carinulata]
MRMLFALYCCITIDEVFTEYNAIWHQFCEYMIDDFVNLKRFSYQRAKEEAFKEISEILKRNRPHLSMAALGIRPIHDNNRGGAAFNRVPDIDNDINCDRHYDYGYDPIDLNVDQKRIFLEIVKVVAQIVNVPVPPELIDKMNDVVFDDEINNFINNVNNRLFYVDGPGGTGKTFLYNCLLKAIQQYFNKKTIAVAWTGIAANLLIGGTTVHKAFKLPINITNETMPGWPLESEQSLAILNEVALIVWDESPMTPKLAIEAVDRYLKDPSKSFLQMGGKCCLFGGDFRQTLPVIIGGHKKDIVNACLKRSVLWSSFTTFHLSINMRARHYVENYEELGNRTFAEWLLNLGDGTIQYVTLHPNSTISGILPDDLIEIPHMLRVSNIDQLIDFVYGKYFSLIENGTSAILCPTNAAVNDINEMIFDRMLENEVKVYYSVDEYKREEDDDFHVTTYLLN